MNGVYKNGNTIVRIESDGTKIRYIPDNAIPHPEYPESIDIKITNKCDVTPLCAMCHEQACADGEHADLLDPLLETLKPYTELAIGGGNPMIHPHLVSFLNKMKKQNVICNITVHWKTFTEYFYTLKALQDEELIHGVGVSVNEQVPCEVLNMLCEMKNIVVHVVMGVAGEEVIRQLQNRGLKILLLGYKMFGRGITYKLLNKRTVEKNIGWIYDNLEDIMKTFEITSFDNLAVEQLDMKKRLEPELYDKVFMGEDGSFTMYIDLVKKEYSKSSTSMRYNIDENDISKLFANLKERY